MPSNFLLGEEPIIAKIQVDGLTQKLSMDDIVETLQEYFADQTEIQIYRMMPNGKTTLKVIITASMTSRNLKIFKSKYIEKRKSSTKHLKQDKSLKFKILAVKEQVKEEEVNLESQEKQEETIQKRVKMERKRLKKQRQSRQSILSFFGMLVLSIAVLQIGQLLLDSFGSEKNNSVYYRFKVNGKLYQSDLQLRKPVNNFNQSSNPSYEYVRKTFTEVLNFPKSEWIEEEENKILKFQKFPNSNPEAIQNFLSLLQQDENPDPWVNLFKNFFKFVGSQKYSQAEYYFFNKTFNLDKYREEIPMCIVATGRNFFSANSYNQFFKSMAYQNYTNFKIIYIDDASTDNSTENLYAYLHKTYPHLRSKTVLIRNREKVGAFMNKDSGIKENCGEKDIIIDIDGDDALIGRQALKVINSIYSDDPNVWVLYTNYMKVVDGVEKKGICRNLKMPPEDYRRKGRNWYTSHLKTYYMKLETKIPIDHLTELHQNPDQSTQIKYSTHASDGIMMYALLELAGLQRIRHIPHLLYFYRVTENTYEWCHRIHQLYDEMKGRSMKPLQPLPNLDDKAKVMESYGEDIELKDYKSGYDTCVSG